MPTPTLATGRPSQYAVALLRIAASLLLLQHGLQKTLGLLGDPAHPMPPFKLMSMFGVAGVIETVLTLFVLVGLFTRPMAFIISGEMAFAYFMVHAPNGLFPIRNMGELPALYSFVFLAIAALGPGALSLDGLRGRSRR